MDHLVWSPLKVLRNYTEQPLLEGDPPQWDRDCSPSHGTSAGDIRQISAGDEKSISTLLFFSA